MSDKPDLSEFEDWLVEGPAGIWPHLLSGGKLNEEQLAIVSRNASLLMNRKRWRDKVERFEDQLSKLIDEKAREACRNAYMIRFDKHLFIPNHDGHNLSRYLFPCGVNFKSASFPDSDVSFSHASFSSGTVSFVATHFGGRKISYTGATFGSGMFVFADSVFVNAEISFAGTNFGKGNIYFLPKELKLTSVSFEDTEIEGNFFVKSSFPHDANFERLAVKGTAQFSDCAFAETPDFRDAKFDRPPEVARMEVPVPDLGGRRFLFRICEDKEAVSKYRKLKSMALAAHDHEMDGKFFAYEMMAKRGTETKGFFPLLFNSLYGVLGGYGQSFMRPIFWLTASLLGFSVAYFYLTDSVLGTPAGIWFAFIYSLRHTFPLVNSFYRFAVKPFEDYESGFQQQFGVVEKAIGNIDSFTHLAILQQFIGLVLLFLLLLALRNTFRLK